jgi:hypothetical protein
MRVSSEGIVTRVFKSSTDLWCVELERTKTGTKGKVKYIGLKTKPKVKVGQLINVGDEI